VKARDRGASAFLRAAPIAGIPCTVLVSKWICGILRAGHRIIGHTAHLTARQNGFNVKNLYRPSSNEERRCSC
jgi:hypothetical protein